MERRQSRMTTPEEEIKRLLLPVELDLLDQLRDRTERLDTRVGDAAALRESTRAVIVEVLRDAGVADHDRLARALAPLIVTSMREEIKNSRDMMVDALYPITGRLVAAAVRNAFKDLLENLNEKLDQSFSLERWRARLQARATGRSEAEILLQRNPPFEIEDLLLVHRPTGLLIARARDEAVRDEDDSDEGSAGVDSDLLGGMLSAIMRFSKDAMGEAHGEELQQLGFGDSELFLRSSPAVILAVRARGTRPTGFEATLESLFQGFLERWGENLRRFDGSADDDDKHAILTDLRGRFAELLEARKQNFGRRSRKGLLLVLLVLLLALAGGIYWGFGLWRAGDIETRARAVLAGHQELTGLPIEPRYNGEILVIEGLFPDRATLAAVKTKLASELAEVPADFRVNFLARDDADRLAAQQASLRDSLGELERSLDQATSAVQPRLDQLGEHISALDSATAELEASIAESASASESATAELEASIAESASASESRATVIDQRIATLEVETGQLESALTAAIEAIEDQTALVGSRTDQLGQMTLLLEESLSETAQNAESRAAGMNQRLQAFSTITRQLEQAVEQMGSTGAAQTAELAGRVAGFETLAGRLDRALKENLAANADQADALDTRTAGLEAVVERLEGGVAEVLELLEAQSREMGERAGELKSASGRIKVALDDAIASAGTVTSLLEQRIGRLESDNDDVRLSLGGLSKDVASLLRPPEITPLERLRSAAASATLYFGERSEFRDADKALETLVELADLMQSTPGGIALRLIGYSDPVGSDEVNHRISLERAGRVAAELTALGVAATRLVIVGRADENLVSAEVGSQSANRRVEFAVVQQEEKNNGNQ